MTHPNTDQGVTAEVTQGWQNCRVGSCLRHEVCMYTPCRAPRDVDALEAEMKRLQQQIEYLTGVPSAPGVINDYRAPEIDAAVLRCRERGDDETAQILARMRLAYREQKDSLTDEIASLKQRLESAEEVLWNIADRKGVCSTCGTMAVGGGSGYTDCDCRRPTWSENDPANYASAFLQEQEKQNG